MRKLLLPFCFIALIASAQQTIYSTNNGLASNPLVWDCTCFPTTEDIIIIDHNIVLDADWMVSDGGRLEVSANGSLTEDGAQQLLIYGNGSQLRVYGTMHITDVAFTNNGGGLNNGNLTISKGIYLGSGSEFTNTASMNGIDSLLNEGSLTNSGIIDLHDMLNLGEVMNSGVIVSDSLANIDTFINSAGNIEVAEFANLGSFSMMAGVGMDVSGDWYNGGSFSIDADAGLTISGDAFSGDSTGGIAVLSVNGSMVVHGDFGNSDNVGGSGDICVGDESANYGSVNGSVDFCDNTGSNFDVNLGTIGGNVTFCASNCQLNVTKQEITNVLLYPNPAKTVLHIEGETAFNEAKFYSLTGELVSRVDVAGKTIVVEGLNAGIYFVKLGASVVKVIIE